jgi:hypothetical protein
VASPRPTQISDQEAAPSEPDPAATRSQSASPIKAVGQYTITHRPIIMTTDLIGLYSILHFSCVVRGARQAQKNLRYI